MRPMFRNLEDSRDTSSDEVHLWKTLVHWKRVLKSDADFVVKGCMAPETQVLYMMSQSSK